MVVVERATLRQCSNHNLGKREVHSTDKSLKRELSYASVLGGVMVKIRSSIFRLAEPIAVGHDFDIIEAAERQPDRRDIP